MSRCVLLTAVFTLLPACWVHAYQPPSNDYLNPRMDPSNPWYESGSAHGPRAPRLLVEDGRYFPDERRERTFTEKLLHGWEVDLGAVGLERRGPRQNGLFFHQSTGESLLATGDIHMGFDAGPLVRVQRHFGPDWSIESVFYGMNNWDYQYNHATVEIAGRDLYGQLYSATGVDFDYGSRLYNFECNLRRRFGKQWTVFGGYRWIEMRDDGGVWLGSYQPDGGPSFGDLNCRFDAMNTLNGFQLGLAHRSPDFLTFHVESELKTGVYNNLARSAMVTTATESSGAASYMRDQRAAFVGEMAVNLIWQPWKHVHGFAGYEVLWIDSAVLAINQLSGQTVGEERVLFNDTAMYHGARAGLRFVW